MTDDMIKVMQRVGKLNDRFQVKRHNAINNDINTNMNIDMLTEKNKQVYEQIHDSAIQKVRDVDMSTSVSGYDKSNGIPGDFQNKNEITKPVKLNNLEQLRTRYRTSINAVIDDQSLRKDVPAGLIKSLVEIESGYNPLHISKQGGKGLMNLTPVVLRRYGVDNPFSVKENIIAGTSLLQEYLSNNNWDYKKALLNYAYDKPGSDPEQFVKDVFSIYEKM